MSTSRKNVKDDVIELFKVEQNNLKGFDLRIPKNKLVVVTGMSGSGKSSLAFETLFAEGQRRYVETFTPYARQFFDRMDKPRVEKIVGIPPSIAIEQRNSVKTTRSTVGTLTEITDYLKSLWPYISTLICPECEVEIEDDTPSRVWESVEQDEGISCLITFSLKLTDRLSADDTRRLLKRQGYVRALIGESDTTKHVARIEDLKDDQFEVDAIEIVQDRVTIAGESRNRFVESVHQAYQFGKNRLTLYKFESGAITLLRSYSRNQKCSHCGHSNQPARPALFNFNHPSGACPDCNGFGRIIHIDYRLAIPDQNLSIDQGVVKPWRTGTGLGSKKDLIKFCKRAGIDTSIPFKDLPRETRKVIIEGEPGYGARGRENKWPHKWYGIKGYFKWLESKSYRMHVRVLLSKYRVYVPCSMCLGKRLKADALNFRVRENGENIDISDFLGLTVNRAVKFSLEWVENPRWDTKSPVRIAAEEIHRRLIFLNMVGLGYLNLDRATRTLSGGETERVSLASCLGTRLVNTLFILDEPSVGLHPRDTEKLVRILKALRDSQNTVVVVEHEAMVMKAADRIIDLGPRNGSGGGEIVFEGTYQKLLDSPDSLTGQYLAGKLSFPVRETKTERRKNPPILKLSGAKKNNLDGLDVSFPVGKLIAVTGVSGSGKTTLIRGCLIPALAATGKFAGLSNESGNDSDLDSLPDDVTEDEESGGALAGNLAGAQHFEDVLFVDQSSLGKTPRSTPAVYTKAFEPIRKLIATSPEAKEKDLNHSAFSFNSASGQCEKCRGAGYEKIEMQFLSDVFVKCPDCDGRRYRKHILEVKLSNGVKAWSVADFLEATIDDAIAFLENLEPSTHRNKSIQCLQPLSDIGLGYLTLGQPINTLSGGENQRLKLVRKLNELTQSQNAKRKSKKPAEKVNPSKTLFLFDEPTTGLHFEDIRLLIELFHKSVNQGHTIIFIEHNLEMIQAADWVIDLGPEAADQGGQIVFQGPPAHLIHAQNSHTASALNAHFTSQYH